MEDKYKYIIAGVLLLIITGSIFFIISKKNINTLDDISKTQSIVDSTNLERNHNGSINFKDELEGNINSGSIVSTGNINTELSKTGTSIKNLEAAIILNRNKLKANTNTSSLSTENKLNIISNTHNISSNPIIKALNEKLSSAYQSGDINKIIEIKNAIKEEQRKNPDIDLGNGNMKAPDNNLKLGSSNSQWNSEGVLKK